MFVYDDCQKINNYCLQSAYNDLSFDPLEIIMGVNSGTTYYIVISHLPAFGETSMDYILNIAESNTCISPTIYANVIPDCQNNGFNIQISADLGSAPSLKIEDNFGSIQTGYTGGVYLWPSVGGPYPNGSQVVITATNEQDANCKEISNITYSCSPVNDDCVNAISITPEADLLCSSPVSGTTEGATESQPTCKAGAFADDDVWYSFQATNNKHHIIVTNTGGTSTDIVTEVFDACGGTSLTCQDTPDSPVELSGLTIGTTYYFRIYTYYGNQTAEFNVCVGTPPPGSDCDNPKVVSNLPYSDTDNTSNYGNYYSGDQGCPPNGLYLNGDDVIYSYTPITTGDINITLSGISDTWAGMFIYTSCADIGSNCIASDVNEGTTDDLEILSFSATAGTTYYIVISNANTPHYSIGYTLNIEIDGCTNPTASYTVVNDCQNSGGFKIDVDITDLGSATSLTISDNYSNSVTGINSPGVVTLPTSGGYSNGDNVIITVTNEQDGTCYTTSNSLTQAACPPPNDNASSAILLDESEDCSFLTPGTTLGATGNLPSGICNGQFGDADDDVWYKFQAESANPSIQVSTNIDIVIELIDTDMTTILDCADYNTSGGETLIASGLLVGKIYYVRVFTYDTGNYADFNICISSIPLYVSSGTTDACITGTKTNVIDGWDVIYDGNSDGICAVYIEPGNPLHTVTVDLYKSSVLRYDSHNLPYINRNITINSSTAPSDQVLVRLFFKKHEFDILAANDPAINTIADINITKTGQPCGPKFIGPGTLLPQINSGYIGENDYFVDFYVNSFSTFFGHSGNSPLPLTLLSFTGEKKGDMNLLEWKTTAEENVSHFEIERSKDGGKFSTYNMVDVVSSTSSVNKYQFMDEYPSGSQYYRLKIVDNDGSYDYSDIIRIHRADDNSSVLIFPNPTRGQVNIDFTDNLIASPVKISLYDITGKVLYNKTIDINSRTHTIDLPTGVSGVVNLRIDSDLINVNERLIILK